jgi:hypothetical protein
LEHEIIGTRNSRKGAKTAKERRARFAFAFQRFFAAQRKDADADASERALSQVEELEQEIDVLVYQLYGLKAGEIKVVEGK